MMITVFSETLFPWLNMHVCFLTDTDPTCYSTNTVFTEHRACLDDRLIGTRSNVHNVRSVLGGSVPDLRTYYVFLTYCNPKSSVRTYVVYACS